MTKPAKITCSACGKKLFNEHAFQNHVRDKGADHAHLAQMKIIPPKVAEEDDDNMGDIFRAVHAARQEKRRDNLTASTQMLVDAGVSFVSKNAGVHLIVNDAVDYWPSTGLWIARNTPHRGRGVRNLMRFIGVAAPKEMAHG